MLIKTFTLPLLLLIIALLVGTSPVKAEDQQNTMLWEMRPNESLIELAAMFYPKSVTMQRAFIAKTQQLNQGTQVYANANTRYPIATNIRIPTLQSLSVKGTGVKKHKRTKKAKQPKNKEITQDEQQLLEKKESMDEVLAKENAKLKALEEQAKQMQQQLDAAEIQPREKPVVKSAPIKKTQP